MGTGSSNERARGGFGERRAGGRTIDPAEEAALLDTIDKWVERDLRPVVKKFDHADEWPAAIVEQMTELGLFGATIGAGVRRPRPAGHAPTPSIVDAHLGRCWMAITGIFNSHLILALAIEKFGTAGAEGALAAASWPAASCAAAWR